MAKAEILEELRQIYAVLKMDVDEDILAIMTVEEIKKEIDTFNGPAEIVAQQMEAIQRKDEALAAAVAKMGTLAPAKTREGALVQIPEYQPIKRLTIRKLRGGSGMYMPMADWTDRDGNPTVKRIMIRFSDDFRLIWDSEVHKGEFEPSVVTFYGGYENLLGIIKAKIEAYDKRKPGSYEIIDKEQMDLLLAEEKLTEVTQAMLKQALENPNDVKSQELFKSIREFREATGKPAGPAVVAEKPSGR